MPSDVEILLTACQQSRDDRTQWLVLADALEEADRIEEAALIRSHADVLVVAGRVWWNCVPGWFLVYAPDIDGAIHLNEAARNLSGPLFYTYSGIVVRGENFARLLVEALMPDHLEEFGEDSDGFEIDPLELTNLEIDSGELEEIVEFIPDHSDA